MLLDVAFLNGQFIACGANGVILTSTDGMTWTQSTSNTTATLWSSTWNGTRYAVCGVGTIVTSTDGATFTLANASVPSSATMRSIISAYNLFVAVGTDPINSQYVTATSADGVTWTTTLNTTIYSQAAFGGIAAALDRFVLCGAASNGFATVHTSQ